MSETVNAARGVGSILHVLDHSWPIVSGYSVRSRNLITAQHRAGQSILALTSALHELDDPHSCDAEVDGVSYLRTPITGALGHLALRGHWPIAREMMSVRLLRRRILQLIETYPISLIYAHSPALCGLAALQAAHRKGLPFIYEIRAFWEDAAVDQGRTTVRSLRYRLTRGLESYVARRADAVSAIARPMLQDLRDRGLPPEKLFHVPNGVDADEFVPLKRDEELARKLNPQNAVVFGFFGSLYRYEGIAWLISAVSQLQSRGQQIKLLIIGAGEEEATIREAVSRHAASEYVSVLPRVSHGEIKKYYSITDVMVFPRLRVRLTELVTPLKPLEAMSMEKPVLASDVGGHRELVQHQVSGLLFRSEDVAEFCQQATRLIASPELRRQLGKQGRELVRREWDWKMVAQRYQRIYDFALQRTHTRNRAFRGASWAFSASGRRKS